MKNMKIKKISLILTMIFLCGFIFNIETSNAQEIKTKSYTCIEDAYVSEEHINENYGYSAFLYVGMYQYFDGEYHHDRCMSFLKFDIQEKPYRLANIKEIYLEIYTDTIIQSYEYPFLVSVYTGSSDWDEYTITYINSPIYNTGIHSVDVKDHSDSYQFNFTLSAFSSKLFEMFDQNDLISFCLHQVGTITGKELFSFKSREWHSGVLTPMLYVKYEAEAEGNKDISGFLIPIFISIVCLSVGVSIYIIAKKEGISKKGSK